MRWADFARLLIRATKWSFSAFTCNVEYTPHTCRAAITRAEYWGSNTRYRSPYHSRNHYACNWYGGNGAKRCRHYPEYWR
jgi:hypothetical protein